MAQGDSRFLVLWQLIQGGWKVVREAHTVLWVVGLLGIPAAVPAWLGWDSPEARALTVFASLCLWGLLFLCALAYFGKGIVPKSTAYHAVSTQDKTKTVEDFIAPKDAITMVNDRLHGTGHADILLTWMKNAYSEQEKIALAAQMLSGLGVTLYGIAPFKSVREPVDTTRELELPKWTDSAVYKANGEELLYSQLAFKKRDVESFIDRSLRDSANAQTTDAEDDGKRAFHRGFNRAAYERDRADKSAAVFRLTQLRGDGVVIRNAASGVRDENLQAWLVQVNGWMNAAIRVIGDIDRSDSEAFRTLDAVPPPRVNIGSACLKPENLTTLFKAYREHDYRLVRLKKLLEKYGVVV